MSDSQHAFLRFKKEVILPRPVRTDNPYKKIIVRILFNWKQKRA